jgi:hypothetical protein
VSIQGASLRKRFLLVPLPLLAALMLTLWAATPSVAAATVLRQDVSGLLYNACAAEAVSYQGTYQMVFADTSGHLELHVTGTGNKGNTYVDNEVALFSFTAKAGETLTISHTSTMISQGSAPNFLVRSNIHVTINADGTVTASFDDETSECQA